ncbi:MAG: RluA family pseudouridine synthase [Kofleriaceae bacterium]|jgi:23S rRNA pseudouridine1911/1915/1917 synthase|nr:RluA family pseudouridine synthase [Kofleriaceae bacterium]
MTHPPAAAEFVATTEDAGRVDRALARRYPTSSRRRLAELFARGAVRIDGKRAAKGDRVDVGARVELSEPPIGRDDLRVQPDPAAAARLTVLWVDPHHVAVSKPAGMPSHPLRAGELGTVASGVVATYPECVDAGNDLREGGLVHRLDTGTSGVLLAARDRATWSARRAQFHAHAVGKTYLAITAAAPGRARCEAPLAQRGDHVVVDYERGLPAETDVVEVRPAARAGWFVVECRARTGRMHQIRAHLAELGAPLVGDARYGGPDHDLGPEVGFFLHAAHLEVPGLPPLAAPPPPGWPG